MNNAVIDRLVAATNAHDLDGLVDCFADDYVNETPTHPGRGFTGREQVHTNWSRIFAGVPDIKVEVGHLAVAGDDVWTEWEMEGTRGDGSPHLMRGVIIFRVGADRITHARFYLEPVDPGEGGVNAAVAQALGQQ